MIQGMELIKESLNDGRDVFASSGRVVVRKHNDMEVHVIWLFAKELVKLRRG